MITEKEEKKEMYGLLSRSETIHPSSTSLISILPCDLLHLILIFSTNEVKGILLFTSVCREWKEIADHSSLWLTCDLSFYAPTNYFRLFETLVEADTDYETAKRRVGNASPVTLRLYSFDAHPYVARRYKITFERFVTTFIVSHHSIEAPTRDHKKEENSVRRRTLTSDTLLAEVEDLPLIQNQVKSIYVPIYRKYHQLWNWYIHWIPTLQYLETICGKCLLFENVFMALLVGIACKVLASALLSTITNVHNGLSLQNHIGFICLYFNGFIYFTLLLLGVIYQICHSIVHTTMLDEVPIPLSLLLRHLVGILLVIGVMGSIGLFHYVLANPSHQNVSYAVILLPMWVSFTCILLIESIGSSPGKVVSMSLLFIPLGFTLLGLYFQDPRSITLHLALLPFYWPVFLVMCFASVWNIQAIHIYHRTPIAERQTSAFAGKMTMLASRNLFLVTLFTIPLVFFAEMLWGSYNLSVGIGIGILWCLSLEAALMLQYAVASKFSVPWMEVINE